MLVVGHNFRAGAAISKRVPEWVDRFLGSDPGLGRLRMALQTVVTIAVIMAAEWLFVRWTGALQTTAPASASPEQKAQVAALNHGLLVVAIMLGAVVGMLASFGAPMFARKRDQLLGFLGLPIPLVAGLSLGLALGSHRTLALISLAVVLSVGTYCRRFGPAGFLGGNLMFMGDFFGFFLHSEIALGDLGWLTAEIVIGVLVAILAQFTLFYPSRQAALNRMLRSYRARARDVARRSRDLLDRSPETPAGEREVRALRRRLVQLNEAALMIDAQLDDASTLPAGWSAPIVHQAVFDAELALTNMSRFSERLAGLPLPASVREHVREALDAITVPDLARAEAAARALVEEVDRLERAGGMGELEHAAGSAGAVVPRRFAGSVMALVSASGAWSRATPEHGRRTRADLTSPSALPDADVDFEASVALAAGWLPGSAPVSATASLEAEAVGPWWVRIGMPPYVRVAIQMGVAVTGAILLGSLLSERRFYWAVIAAFVTFMGANNAGEQLRKGLMRVLGTLVGVVLGAVIAHTVADRTLLAIAVILFALFLGLYLMRISYAFMVIGITVMVSQLYVELGEFSDSLLLLRLEETMVGAAVAAIAALCVLPLHTKRVTRVAAREYVQAIAAVADEAVARLLDAERPIAPLRKAIRDTDAAYQALLAAVPQVRVSLPGVLGSRDPVRAQILHAAAAGRHYGRNLIVDTEIPVPLDDRQRAALLLAGDQLSTSLSGLAELGVRAVEPAGEYVRSAALFSLVENACATDSPANPAGHRTEITGLTLALRDLQLLDGAMASLAQVAGMPVRALDTPAAVS